jgi:hypothetical protein
MSPRQDTIPQGRLDLIRPCALGRNDRADGDYLATIAGRLVRLSVRLTLRQPADKEGWLSCSTTTTITDIGPATPETIPEGARE